MGLDADEIEERLENDQNKYGNFAYYLGILLALGSSALDGLTYFIIRTIGQDLPTSIIPFGSGLFTTTMLSIFMIVSAIFFPKSSDDNAEVDPPYALLIAFIGCVIGWLALEVMVIGLRMSKSALASYGE